MPRIYRNKKEVERFLIREFLGHLGYKISNPGWQERPDALLTLSKGGTRKRVAVEHTEYFNDTVAGQQSALTPIDDFWTAVQASLLRRISHRKHLTGISASVDLKKNLPNPRDCTELARQLAEALVDFVESHPVKKRQRIFFYQHDFNGHPTLKSLLCSLSLLRFRDYAVPASRCYWICSNTADGNIGFSLRYIKTAIENKNKKAADYENWADASEKWLLIAASGTNVSNQAGRPVQNVDWADPDLLTLCRKSPFDKIVFWERICCWYKWLKPSKKVVQ